MRFHKAVKAIQEKAKIAKYSILQDKAIEKCLYCQPIKKEIEVHHNKVKCVHGATIEIIRCQECRIRVNDIINCAKRGHLIP